MPDVTLILSRVDAGNPSAPEQLLLLVYDERRTLAAARLAQNKPGPTLQATASVQEAYFRLVDSTQSQHWNSRGLIREPKRCQDEHFFGFREARRAPFTLFL